MTKKERSIVKVFLDIHIFKVTKRPWFTNMTNFKVENEVSEMNSQVTKKERSIEFLPLLVSN